MIPRPYQTEAAAAVWRMAQDKPALVALPTGTGKTFVQVLTANLVRERDRRPILWLAHRKELIGQAVKAFAAAGWTTFVEQAAQKTNPFQAAAASTQRPTVVCASVATLQRRRLERWSPDAFGAVLVDEAHHGVAASWRRLLEHWRCPILGFSATPQRQGLSDFFSLAYSMPLRTAIEQGWLVPLHGQTIVPAGWDMSRFKSPRGAQDINIGELCKMVDSSMNAAIAALRPHLATNQTLAFWPSVQSAKTCARVLDAEGTSACWVSGESDSDDRLQAVTAFRDARIQVLSNCAVLTEGFDAPSTRVLAMGRPTRSEVLFMQMLGRSLRPLPGVIDGLDNGDDRRTAIAESAKPHALVLDYQGVGAQFDVMSLTSVLGTGQSAAAKARAAQHLASDSPKDVLETLDAAELEERRIEREKRTMELAEARALRDASTPVPSDELEITYRSTAAPWLTTTMESRFARHALARGPRASDKQRRLLYRLVKQAGVDQRLANQIWQESPTWSKRRASQEINHWSQTEIDTL